MLKPTAFLQAAALAASTAISASSALAGNWVPSADDTWQWQLTGPLNTSYDVSVYDIDLFDTEASQIAALQAQGRSVVCYFSPGSSENWRADFSRFEAADMGHPMEDWDGERWLDTRSANVRKIMRDRMQLAAAKGCDGVEPDNMDGYQNENGVSLTEKDHLDYARYIAGTAHEFGLMVGLKNGVDTVGVLAPVFDFAVNEECHQYQECAAYDAFIALGKPVFNAEYEDPFVENTNDARDKMCAASMDQGLHSLVLAWDLDDSLRYSCDEGK